MRKIYLTLLLVAAFGWANAQSLTPHFRDFKNLEIKSVDRAEIIKHDKARKVQNSKSTFSRWFYQPDAFSQFNTPAGANFKDFIQVTIFPDSTMLWGTASDPTSHIFMHSLGITMDPASPLFSLNDPTKDFDWNTEYSFDSLQLGYIYRRHTKDTIVDTLVVQVQINTLHWSLEATKYKWVYDVYGVSKMNVEAILHKDFTWDATNHPDANVVLTKKFPLTIADTSGSTKVRYLEEAIGINIPAGRRVKATFTFIPGYTWAANVDSIAMYNRFAITTFGNSSLGTYPYYEIDDYNTNAIFTTWEYRDSSDNYAPVFFYLTKPFPYQYHNIAMKFTALNIGIEETTNVIEVKQNQPNPFTGSTTINYTLNNSANVAVVIYNVAGAKVMSINEGMKASGSHSLRINASNLQAGVYYYTFTADGYTVTKKMIVY